MNRVKNMYISSMFVDNPVDWTKLWRRCGVNFVEWLCYMIMIKMRPLPVVTPTTVSHVVCYDVCVCRMSLKE